MKTSKCLQIALICFVIISCNTKQWKEVDTVNDIKKGNLVKLEPLKDTILVLSGSGFTVTNINFKCSALQPTAGMKYKSAMVLNSSLASGTSSSETIESGELQKWPQEAKEQNIKIPVMIMSDLHQYKGKGQIYLYLTDTTHNCISNIIAWKVKFI